MVLGRFFFIHFTSGLLKEIRGSKRSNKSLPFNESHASEFIEFLTSPVHSGPMKASVNQSLKNGDANVIVCRNIGNVRLLIRPPHLRPLFCRPCEDKKKLFVSHNAEQSQLFLSFFVSKLLCSLLLHVQQLWPNQFYFSYLLMKTEECFGIIFCRFHFQIVWIKVNPSLPVVFGAVVLKGPQQTVSPSKFSAAENESHATLVCRTISPQQRQQLQNKDYWLSTVILRKRMPHTYLRSAPQRNFPPKEEFCLPEFLSQSATTFFSYFSPISLFFHIFLFSTCFHLFLSQLTLACCWA